jgi:phage terminase large subunit
MNSIDDSVHLVLGDLIAANGWDNYFNIQQKVIYSRTGGSFQYKGLARNINSIKSMQGFDAWWVEEAATVSKQSWNVLIPTVRKAGSELWVVFNPESTLDATYLRWVKPYEAELDRYGYYEDDTHIIIKANYSDNPFYTAEHDILRQEDKKRLLPAEYQHIWEGQTNDNVEGSIIRMEWVEAAIDAHKIERFQKVFEPKGARIASFDVADEGSDAKAFALRHGSIIKSVKQNKEPNVDIAKGCEWALLEADACNANVFVYDADGMGAGLKHQIDTHFSGCSVETLRFKGSLSGSGQDRANEEYQATTVEVDNPLTYSDVFLNNRAQYYHELATRLHNTYKCVVEGAYIDPAEMIAIDSDSIDEADLRQLKAELCKIPKRPNNNGLIQIMSKQDMMRLKNVKSPNMADAVMMSLVRPTGILKQRTKFKPISYPERRII